MMFLKRFARDEWNIGIVDQTIEDIARHGIQKPVRWFPSDAWRIFADPFCMVHPDRRVTILAEMLNHWIGKGEIWSATVAADSDPVDAVFHRHVVGAVHLSYPRYVPDGEDNYAIAESYEADGLFLWRQEDDRWVYVKSLLTGPVIDATIYRDEAYWWLFCTFANDGPDERLHLFYSNSLLGDWTAHPLNPVKTDRASARPAGSLFHVDGKLIRPSQDSSRTYGGSLVLNHVISLSPDSFVEKPYRYILPQSDYYADGIHTISGAGSYTIIDGKRWHFGSANLARVIIAKAFKMYRQSKASKTPPHAILQTTRRRVAL